MASSKERETFVYIAKLAEQAERYDEMVDAMKKLAKLDVELTVEERNLLSVGYKNVIGARRASWRILSSIEQKEESKGNELNAKRIKEYRQKVESELSNICGDIMTVIDEHLIPSSSAGESTVFYYKMKGDYYRYLAEFKTGNEKKEAADQSLKAYQLLDKTHISLGLERRKTNDCQNAKSIITRYFITIPFKSSSFGSPVIRNLFLCYTFQFYDGFIHCRV